MLGASKRTTPGASCRHKSIHRTIIRMTSVLRNVQQRDTSSQAHSTTHNAGADTIAQRQLLLKPTAIFLARAMSMKSVVATALTDLVPTSRALEISLAGMATRLMHPDHMSIQAPSGTAAWVASPKALAHEH